MLVALREFGTVDVMEEGGSECLGGVVGVYEDFIIPEYMRQGYPRHICVVDSGPDVIG